MAENPDRFVIIDGVQVSRERAKRKGLIDADGNPIQAGPNESRARTQGSARRPGSGGSRAAAAPVTTAQVGDGAVSTGEDAQSAGASAEAVTGDASAPAGTEATGDDASAAAADAAAAAVDDASAAPASDDASGKAPTIKRR